MIIGVVMVGAFGAMVVVSVLSWVWERRGRLEGEGWRRLAGDAIAPPMGKGKLLEAFSGAERELVFKGVLCVCRGERDIARTNADLPRLEDGERAYWCGAARALEEMEERMLSLVAGEGAGVSGGGRGERLSMRGGEGRRRPAPAVMEGVKA